MRDARSFDDFYAGSVGEAEDIAQEAFAKAWQHWGKVSGYADPEAWVRTVAFRMRVSVWRKATGRVGAHRRHGPADDLPGLSPDYLAIVSGLRNIPEAQRRAIVLHHFVGLSVDEVARETGVAVGTVKARLSRGRQALAPYLSDDEDGGRNRQWKGVADHG
jgi:RNA polymerase sigma-70 factor, ECF subfamily